MKIKKGDKVKVIAGDDKGVVAEVVAALPRSNRVIVQRLFQISFCCHVFSPFLCCFLVLPVLSSFTGR